MKKDLRPLKMPRSKPVKLQIPCLNCKELFWTTEADIAKGRKYCGMECVGIYRKFGTGKHSRNRIKKDENSI